MSHLKVILSIFCHEQIEFPFRPLLVDDRTEAKHDEETEKEKEKVRGEGSKIGRIRSERRK